MKKTVLNLILLAASFTVALGVGELVARLYLSYQDRMLREKRKENILTQVPKHELFVPMKLGSFANKPNATAHWWGFDIHTDSLGCRQGISAPDAVKVILFIGDSMIFGLGLPDSLTIPSLLQRAINSFNPDHPVRVINAAVIGYDFQQYLYQIERLVPKIKPYFVLVGLCYNDLLPNEDPFGNVLRDRGLNAQVTTDEADSQPQKKTTSLSRIGIKSLYRNLGLYKLWKQSNLGNKSKRKPTTYSEPAVIASQKKAPELVDEFLATVRKLNVPSAFVYFPTPDQLGRESDLVYVKLLSERNQAVLDLSHISDLNVEHFFLREKDGYMKPDIHFNLQGSQTVAEQISRWLVEKGILN